MEHGYERRFVVGRELLVGIHNTPRVRPSGRVTRCLACCLPRRRTKFLASFHVHPLIADNVSLIWASHQDPGWEPGPGVPALRAAQRQARTA